MQFRQCLIGEGFDLRHVGGLRFLLNLLDGLFGGFDLTRGIGLIEGCAVCHLRNQFLGLVGHFFTGRDRQVELFGDFRQVLVGRGAVVDDDDGVVLDLFRFGLLMSQTTGLDVGHAFGRSIVDEIGRRLGKSTAGTQTQQR